MNSHQSKSPALADPPPTSAEPVFSSPVRGFASRVWRGGWFLPLLALAGCWLLLFDALRGEWQINPQYNFGWAVPLLSVSLLLRRWGLRPAPARPASRRGAVLIAIGLLLLMLPLRIILEANPEWRLIYWIQGAQMVGLSLCFLYGLGGWVWVRFFAPPVLFLFISIPWPVGLETAVIQGLMRFVAGLTTEGVSWLGIPAVQRGNLIEVGVGVVGIDEACSGVNSLQSALMISLFLGEQNRFAWKGRIGLLLGSVVFVLLANIGRTTFLVWTAATHDLRTMESWHDTIGILVMVVVLAMMFGLAWCLKPKLEGVNGLASRTPILDAAPPRGLGIAALVWISGVILATELWFHSHETALILARSWSFVWPTSKREFKSVPIPETSLAILRCSHSESGSWYDEDGNEWSAFVLRWEAGRNSSQLAKGHRPDICFPAAGAKLANDFGQITLDANGLKMSFRHQSFERGPRGFHVFYCLWSDRISTDNDSLLEDGSPSSRLAAVLAGRRHVGQQVLEIVVQGPDTRSAAVELVQEQLGRLVKLE